MIQASQAEKNRAAAASKYKKEQDRGTDGQGAGTMRTVNPQADTNKKEYNNKVYVGGLVDVLKEVSESDIRQVRYIMVSFNIIQWFNPFGDIDTIELPKDPVTGQNKGHAIIEFHSHRHAKNAVREMNGFEIRGR